MKIKIVTLLIITLLIFCCFGTIGTTIDKNIENDIPKKEEHGLGDLPRSDPAPFGKKYFAGSPPDSWNWRNANLIDKSGDWTTSIKKQGECNSCYAFSPIASLESAIKIANNNPNYNIDLSEQYIISCGSCCMNYIKGCTEASFDDVMIFLKNYGIISESHFKYDSTDGTPPGCEAKDENWRDSLRTFYGSNLVSADINSIKCALIEYGPVSAYMKVYSNFKYDYTGGIYSETSGSLLGTHRVTIVGYQDYVDTPDTDDGYWICKNSWGTDWGEKGWCKIEYGICGTEDDVGYISHQGEQPICFGRIYKSASGQIEKGDDYCIKMSREQTAGTAIYEFDLGSNIKIDTTKEFKVGIEIKEWGNMLLFSYGPTFKIYNYETEKYDTIGDYLGYPQTFTWFWRNVNNINNYIKNGIVKVKVYADENDYTALRRVGLKYTRKETNTGPILQVSKSSHSFGKVDPEQQLSFSFDIYNTGDIGSTLNWIIDVPSWMKSFLHYDPQCGGQLKRTSSSPAKQSVTISFKALDEKGGKYDGNIKVTSTCVDYKLIDVSLKIRGTPKVKTFVPSFIQIFQTRFPYLCRMINSVM